LEWEALQTIALKNNLKNRLQFLGGFSKSLHVGKSSSIAA
jgi:hypothetical protein